MTPVYAGVGEKLVDSLRNETIVHDDAALRVFRVRPADVARGDRARARPRGPRDRRDAVLRRGVRGGTALRRRPARVAARGRRARSPCGTPGCRRVRADPADRRRDGVVQGRAALAAARPARRARRGARGCAVAGATPSGCASGDTVDFWRVEAFEPDRLLRLQRRDEGARPGLAPVRGLPDAARRRDRHADGDLRPSGLFGLVYWYALWPFHGYIFGGMLRELCGLRWSRRADARPHGGAPEAG